MLPTRAREGRDDTREACRQDRLDNGLTLTFVDRTSRYFGDYHRVCVDVLVSLDLDHFQAGGDPDREALMAEARASLGPRIDWRQELVRMGVAGAEVEKIRQELIDAFVAANYGYFRRPDFPARLIRSKLHRAPQGRFVPLP